MLRLLVPMVLTATLTTACAGNAAPSPSPTPRTATVPAGVDATARGFTAATMRHFSTFEVAWYGGSGKPGRHVDTALSFAGRAPVKTLYVSASRRATDPKQYRCGTDAGYAVQSCRGRAAGVDEVLLSRAEGPQPAVIARHVTERETITILAWPEGNSAVPLTVIRGVLEDPAISLDGSRADNRAGEKLSDFHQLRGGSTLEPVSPQ